MNILLKWDVDLLSLLKYWIHYPANHLFLCRHFQGLCGVVGRDLSWWMFHRYSEKFMTNQTSKDSNTKLWMWSILSIPTFRTSAAQLWIWKNMFMVNNFLSTFAFRTSTLFYWMTRTALYTISLENHIKKSPVGRLYTLIWRDRRMALLEKPSALQQPCVAVIWNHSEMEICVPFNHRKPIWFNNLQ